MKYKTLKDVQAALNELQAKQDAALKVFGEYQSSESARGVIPGQRYDVKHGAFLDADVVARAAGLREA